jgi:hypothetical protein
MRLRMRIAAAIANTLDLVQPRAAALDAWLHHVGLRASVANGAKRNYISPAADEEALRNAA